MLTNCPKESSSPGSSGRYSIHENDNYLPLHRTRPGAGLFNSCAGRSRRLSRRSPRLLRAAAARSSSRPSFARIRLGCAGCRTGNCRHRRRSRSLQLLRTAPGVCGTGAAGLCRTAAGLCGAAKHFLELLWIARAVLPERSSLSRRLAVGSGTLNVSDACVDPCCPSKGMQGPVDADHRLTSATTRPRTLPFRTRLTSPATPPILPAGGCNAYRDLFSCTLV